MEWDPPLPAGWNDTHRAFLQALMARGSMTFGQGQRILAAIFKAEKEADVDPAAVDLDAFEQYMRAAREAVAPLDLDIRKTRHQVRKEQVWAFVNAASDPVTQLGTVHSPDEIAYLKRLLDAMFDGYNTRRMEVMAVDEAQALKVSRPARAGPRENSVHDNGEGAADKGLKHSEVMALLASLLAEGWLERSSAGFYTLSPRALMELEHWLTETYNDPDAGDWQRIKRCEACKGIVTMGQRCADQACHVRMHDICDTDAYWRSRGNQKKCRSCSTAWDGKHFVGERAVTSTQAFQRSQGRKPGRKSAMDEVMAAQEEGSDDDEDEDEEEDDDDDDDGE